ncbi:transposase [Leisingera sp. NJS204]|nr:transposase [Leisingera sp. NJS204]
MRNNKLSDAGGGLYPAAAMGWHSRKLLIWRLSGTMNAGFCIEALKEALARRCPPGIFNSDQGYWFPNSDFTSVLRAAKVKIQVDGRGLGYAASEPECCRLT